MKLSGRSGCTSANVVFHRPCSLVDARFYVVRTWQRVDVRLCARYEQATTHALVESTGAIYEGSEGGETFMREGPKVLVFAGSPWRGLRMWKFAGSGPVRGGPLRPRRRSWAVVVFVGSVGLVTLFGVLILGVDEEERRHTLKASTEAAGGAFGEERRYNFVVVSDMDKDSKREQSGTWVSFLKNGTLVKFKNGTYHVVWTGGHDDLGVELHSTRNEEGRGMELSELEYFAGKMVACDDRTGTLFHVKNGGASDASVEPWIVLHDADGSPKNGGFKTEWMAVKDDLLYVGSHGREVTDPHDGTVVTGKQRLWVKTVDRDGNVEHHNWAERYDWLRRQVGVPFPGYLIHESVLWQEESREWIFFPRRWSKEAFDEEKNEWRGWSRSIIVSEDFDQADTRNFNSLAKHPTRGFSSVKFVPGSSFGAVMALRTVEDGARHEYQTYISVLNFEHSEVLMEEELIAHAKYEGITFLREE